MALKDEEVSSFSLYRKWDEDLDSRRDNGFLHDILGMRGWSKPWQEARPGEAYHPITLRGLAILEWLLIGSQH